MWKRLSAALMVVILAAPAALGESAQPLAPKPQFLTLKSDLTLYIGNNLVARGILGSLLDATTGGDKETSVFLRAERTVPYDELMRVVGLLRTAGYLKIILVENEKPQPPAPIAFETAPVPPGLPIPAPTTPNVPRGSLPLEVVPTWKSQVVALLEQNKHYPEQARSNREQGVAQIFFSLDRQGRVLESRVVRSSGSRVLDAEALELLRRAQPFPPPPKELKGDHVDLTVPIRFNLLASQPDG
jgi:TonB family protein